jgi:hypothetical protein
MPDAASVPSAERLSTAERKDFARYRRDPRLRRVGTGPSLWIVVTVVVVLLTGCDSRPGIEQTTEPTAPSTPGSRAIDSPSSGSPPALDCDGGGRARTTWFTAEDGTRLYGAILGSGRVGVVVANDVPHSICEALTPARLLAAQGYRVLLFDYRDRGLSDASDHPARLDLDVAGAVRKLRWIGANRVFVMGSYAGVAAGLVAAIEIRPPVDGLIGISPAPIRGQWVEGPFGPIGAYEAGPRLRIPILYITVRTDSYVPFRSVRRLYRLTASPDKDLLVIPSGSTGFNTIDFNSYSGRVRKAILSFLVRLAGTQAT